MMWNKFIWEKLNLASIFIRFFIFSFIFFLLLFCLYSPRIINYFYRNERSIHVLTFTDMISQESVKKFEEQTGIKVHVTYFESNDELLAKLKIDKGAGYDLLITTDYMIESLIKFNLLKSLNISKISNFEQIDKRFINRYFDPQNKYSVPHSWSIFGLAYKKESFDKVMQDPTWGLIFDPENWEKYKIAMPSDPREILFLTSLYLFGKPIEQSKNQLKEIRDLLIKQRKYVESYSSEKIDYFLYAGIVPVVPCESLFFRKMLINNPKMKDEFAFIIPKEGSLLTIENLAILEKSQKEELTYKFIDYLVSSTVNAMNSNDFGFNPVNKVSYELIDKSVFQNKSFFPSEEMFKKLDTLHNDIPLDVLDELWLSIRIS
ncbi:TPA: hypothetical protein DEO28_03160 [Candidatus Dependentiae bacterium]|nr:MAG: Extracellular solute-binding protein family 1 [candidate division TM6 bacterium GW2011_GWE2_31_21]KKP53095.1 MAG: Extracellular solute-binding protein family 1 [candidate division TM6 bacterium GW2011_GWF2_33_332]HBS47913.1 hypothetical protein [Candidatus Dependentiae bacterium]HBZ73483.1 hypothetical protein [Candidatus Dependentiae bacterium]